jgi:hypothetical protein
MPLSVVENSGRSAGRKTALIVEGGALRVITVVMTHSPDFRLKPVPGWLGRLAYPDFPRVAEAWTARQNVHDIAAALSLGHDEALRQAEIEIGERKLADGSMTGK